MFIYLKKIGLILFLIFFLLTTGCVSPCLFDFKSERKMIGSEIDSDYKKKIGILQTVNSTNVEDFQLSHDTDQCFVEQILAVCPDALPIASFTPGCPDFLKFPPLDGVDNLDYYELVKLGRNNGFTTLVFRNIEHIGTYRQNIGFLWFKKNKVFLEVHVTAKAIDLLTGAISSKHTKKFKGIEVDELQTKSFMFEGSIDSIIGEFNQGFAKVSDKLGRLIGLTIANKQWAATVIAIEGGRIIISPGSDVGISIGDCFTILCGKRIVHGLGDRVFFVPGHNIGELEIIKVNDQYAEGVFVGNELPVIGSVVIPK